MKIKFEHIPSIVRRFGMINGIKLYYKLKYGKALTVPGIKNIIQLRKNTSDNEAFFQIFINKEYDNVKSKEAKFILDGGANIGLFAIKMKSLFPDANIFCIEPDTENFEQLNKNLEHYDSIVTIHAGLWNKSASLKLNDTVHGKWGVIVEEDPVHGNIEAISIDHLMEKHNIPYIDILKLDIESSEKKIFSSDCSSWLPKVKMLVVELHDFMEDGCAKEFFKTILGSYENFSYKVSGENTIIVNNDFKYP